ncbi:MAG: hypothetical protein K0Q72_4037 [Armatimonadetes bacterium]|nr:hypothetical protein [Armatimonadota bacterium]
MRRLQVAWVAVALALCAVGVQAVSTAPRKGRAEAGFTRAHAKASEASCRQAVQAFRNRPRDFSATLRQGLAEDLAAAKKSPDEIVSLDFEPFVNSQDPASRYVARKVTRSGQSYRVAVHAVVDGKVSETPDVVPELVIWRGHWTFVNFHYPGSEGEAGTNLLKLLRELRDARRKPARRSR